MNTRSTFTLLVLSIHGLALVLMMFGTPKILKQQRDRIVVRTVNTPSPVKTHATSIASAKTTQTKKTAQKKDTPKNSEPIKESAKKETAKSPTKAAPQTSKPVKKNAQPSSNKPAKPAIPNALLDELDKSIENMAKPSKSKAPRGKAHMPSLEIEQGGPISAPSQDLQYQEILAAFFHEQLQLPEFGEVTIKVTVHKDGTIKTATVTRSESSKNRKYLEEQLPRLHLPRPTSSTFFEDQQTFLITFSHEF